MILSPITLAAAAEIDHFDVLYTVYMCIIPNWNKGFGFESDFWSRERKCATGGIDNYMKSSGTRHHSLVCVRVVFVEGFAALSNAEQCCICYLSGGQRRKVFKKKSERI